MVCTFNLSPASSSSFETKLNRTNTELRPNQNRTKTEPWTMQQSVVESVLACDREQQAQLFNSVVLAGGGCCFEGLAERLKAEIEASLDAPSTGWRVKVLAAGSGERK